jgi:hypothetical protein
MNNERIQELYAATCLAAGNLSEEDFCEKFAELIIRKCAKVADLAQEHECEWIGGNILTHFGVRE